MCGIVREIPFDDFDEGFPALLTLVMMPFTFSITNGIGAGFVSHVFIKLTRGKGRQVHWMMVLVTLAFLIYFCQDWLKKGLKTVMPAKVQNRGGAEEPVWLSTP